MKEEDGDVVMMDMIILGTVVFLLVVIVDAFT